MTPLAHYLARQLTSQIKDRHPFWAERQNADNLRELMTDTHYFECTEVIDLFPIVKETSQEWFDARTFLPAPNTWIEWDSAFGRQAVHFRDMTDGWAFVSLVFPDAAAHCGRASFNGDYNVPGTDKVGLYALPTRISEAIGSQRARKYREAAISTGHFFLVIINSPHIIGRITRTPHRGIERELRKKFPIYGKYPLHAWHELKLEVNLRHENEHTGEIYEAHLTGKKCLHFCRSHLRVRMGRLELVSAHWRGDPALGIKRTRYKVMPPRNAVRRDQFA